MKELVELLVRNLVDQPTEVRVREIQGERGITYELSVAPSDMGKVIGKGGRIIKAIRSVVAAAAIQEQKRIHIEIV